MISVIYKMVHKSLAGLLYRDLYIGQLDSLTAVHCSDTGICANVFMSHLVYKLIRRINKILLVNYQYNINTTKRVEK